MPFGSLITGGLTSHSGSLESEHVDKAGASSGRPVVEVYKVQYPPRRHRQSAEGQQNQQHDVAGSWLLGISAVLLLVLAAAMGYVSFRAQYGFVHAEKGEPTASMLEALGLDCAAVIFALLALAQARLGRPALTERFLNCDFGRLRAAISSAGH